MEAGLGMGIQRELLERVTGRGLKLISYNGTQEENI